MSRVVITGLGMTSCLGLSLTDNWNHICGRLSGLTESPFSHKSQLGRLSEGISSEFIDSYMKLTNTLHSKLQMTTAIEVLNNANFFPSTESEKQLIGISESLSIPDLQSDYLKVGSFTGSNISTALNFKGPVTVSGSGLQAIVEACQMVRNNEVQVALALGSSVDLTESLLENLSRQAFTQDFNTHSEQPSELAPAEGSAGLLIESLTHAKARNARIFAEVEMHSQTTAHDSSEMPVEGDVILAASFGVQQFEQCLKKWTRGSWLDIKKNVGWVLNADGINDAVVAALILTQGVIPPCFESGKLVTGLVQKASVISFTTDWSAWHLELSKFNENE